MSADLHLHTVHSDGSWTPTELVNKAIELKLKVIAVTDHDTTAGLAEAQTAAGDKVEVIPGIEINSVLVREDGTRMDIHLLGYFIAADSGALQAVIKRQQDARQQLVEDTIAKMKSIGITLTREIVEEESGKGSIGRPHLTRAIVRVGGAPDVNAGFERFMHRKSPDFIPRHSVTPEDAIAAITAAGGIASIAHPGKNPAMDEVITALKEQGLRGIEAYHRSHGLPLIKKYLKMAAAKGMLVTGGSDCHGPYEDYPPSIGTLKVPIQVVQNLKAAKNQSSLSN